MFFVVMLLGIWFIGMFVVSRRSKARNLTATEGIRNQIAWSFFLFGVLGWLVVTLIKTPDANPNVYAMSYIFWAVAFIMLPWTSKQSDYMAMVAGKKLSDRRLKRALKFEAKLNAKAEKKQAAALKQNERAEAIRQTLKA